MSYIGGGLVGAIAAFNAYMDYFGLTVDFSVLKSKDLPAWLQAFGGLAAIGVTSYIAVLERRGARRAEAREMRSVALAERDRKHQEIDLNLGVVSVATEAKLSLELIATRIEQALTYEQQANLATEWSKTSEDYLLAYNILLNRTTDPKMLVHMVRFRRFITLPSALAISDARNVAIHIRSTESDTALALKALTSYQQERVAALQRAIQSLD